MRARRAPTFALAATLIAAPMAAWAWTPLPNASDPLVRMPGTQPTPMVVLQPAQFCFDCHRGLDPAVAPGFAFGGSNMAQAARDPFFWAALTVAAQDSIYALGRPNATDLCLRCHLPSGWLNLRSDPPNGSLMNGTDFDGVTCDLCHRMIDPFFADTHAGTREGADWGGYWDETNLSSTPSQAAADAALAADQSQSASIRLWNGNPFYDASYQVSTSPGYDENASGQYFVSMDSAARGEYADGSLPHERVYSRYHKSKYFCSTCHDVSNTAIANMAFASSTPLDGTTVLPSESEPAYSHAPLERTFSEMMLSDYGLPGGAPGVGAFAGQTIRSCQDCHMPGVTGAVSNFPGGTVRPTESQEHPQSPARAHDMTGGNALLPWLLASAVPGSPNHDPVNEALLGQGAQKLTMTLDQGLPLDPLALLAARNRTVASLSRAAAITGLTYDPSTGVTSFRIENHTGHKLLTGYPEGRRMFVGVKVYQGQTLLEEVNPYDASVGTLKGLPASYSPASPPLGAGEVHRDDLVFEAHTRSTITGEAQSFHFVLATGLGKDNRIPPKGFRVAEAAARRAEPMDTSGPAPGMFSPAEYAGGHRDVALTLPAGGDRVVVELSYQATSREYVEFLRDEIDGTASSLPLPAPSGEPKAYVAQTDAFFSGLRAWGSTIWQIWQHNKGVPGAAPIVMTRSVVAMDTCATQADGAPCDDGDACTTGDACQSGVCKGGPPPLCDDGNDCTDDGCDSQAGCVHTFNTAPCEDGDLCTAPDSCAFGVCVPGPGMDCSDTEYCTDDSCDPQMGCVHTPKVDPACETDGGSSSSSSSSSSSTSGATTTTTTSSVGGSGGTGGATTTSEMPRGGAGGIPPTGSGGSMGGEGGGEVDAGCGCGVVGDAGAPPAAILGLLGLLLARRKRRWRG
jgi:MYXO-CTERM domain-containing protein